MPDSALLGQAVYLSVDLLWCLQHVHMMNVWCAPQENVLLDSEGHIKVTDFGLAKGNMADGERTNSFIGTMEYMAPEIIQGKGHGKDVDWWSVGILLFEMMTGMPPFNAKSRNQLQKQITGGKLKYPCKHVCQNPKQRLKPKKQTVFAMWHPLLSVNKSVKHKPAMTLHQLLLLTICHCECCCVPWSFVVAIARHLRTAVNCAAATADPVLWSFWWHLVGILTIAMNCAAAFLSRNAQSLLKGLLVRDVEKRLGHGPEGSKAVMDHPFFSCIKWDKLQKREIPSPFKPSTQGLNSVENFDKMWTEQSPTDSPAGTPTNLESMFHGYSYCTPHMLANYKQRSPSQ